MQNILIGKTITAVYLADDNKSIKFDILNGESIIAKVDGDCCSSTWIESLDTPEYLLGKVINVEDLYLNNRQENEGTVIAFYGVKVQTTAGTCVIDYRNESNGYYGGSMWWPSENERQDYFYGGVFGQNKSSMNFVKVV